MSSLVITADTVVLADRVIARGSVVIVDGLIAEIGEAGSISGDPTARTGSMPLD